METDTKSLFQITEAAHACGVSRSTLMRMEEKGLLAPVYVAPESGRRYYDNHNIARVLQIEKFKSMGLGAQEIADYFVRGGEVSGLLAVLEERLQELLQGVEELRLRAGQTLTLLLRGGEVPAARERPYPVVGAADITPRRDLLYEEVYGTYGGRKVCRHVWVLQRVYQKGLCAF